MNELSVLVVDPAGTLFTNLRKAGVGVALWRAKDLDAVRPDATELALVSAADLSWDDLASLAARVATIVVADTGSDADALRALERGAIGYIDVRMPRTSLRRAIAAALRGEVVYSRRVLATGIRAQIGSRVRSWVALTPRQRQVLTLISQGATDKQIGAALGIAPATAQKHASNLVRRLGVPNRAAAVANAAAS